MGLAGPKRFEQSSNRALLLRRSSVETTPEGKNTKARNVANAEGDSELQKALIERRRAAARHVVGGARQVARVIRLRVESDLAVWHSGAGTTNDNGIALDGLSGAPALPATGLKGLCHAVADADDQHVFGTADDVGATIGSVTFLNGLATESVSVGLSVLTPHEPDYYGDPGQFAPAMISAPNPVVFPVVTGGVFEVTLIGPEADVIRAAELLKVAVDELGIGAKTSAGYGYLSVTSVDPP